MIANWVVKHSRAQVLVAQRDMHGYSQQFRDGLGYSCIGLATAAAGMNCSRNGFGYRQRNQGHMPPSPPPPHFLAQGAPTLFLFKDGTKMMYAMKLIMRFMHRTLGFFFFLKMDKNDACCEIDYEG